MAGLKTIQDEFGEYRDAVYDGQNLHGEQDKQVGMGFYGGVWMWMTTCRKLAKAKRSGELTSEEIHDYIQERMQECRAFTANLTAHERN